MMTQHRYSSHFIALLAQAAVCWLMLFQPAIAAQEDSSAVIIMYHRFGEGQFPTTNITIEQFEAQLAELKKEKYHVVPLEEIVAAFKNKAPLPPRTVAITIDDAYLTIFTEAWPRLKAANFPFTVFVSTDPVSRNFKSYMSWQQIRTLSQDPLVRIGHHAHSHDHLLEMPLDVAKMDIKTANDIYKKELGYIPDIFAYPYGEFSPALQDFLKENGTKAAFGQFSSVASSRGDLYGLPRFSFNEKYSTPERFRLIVNAQALPAYDILPASPIVTQNPPKIGFTVDSDLDDLRHLSALTCYLSHMKTAADITRIGKNRIEVRFDKPLPKGRSKINCTMPSPDRRWYWFGLPFFVQ